jgi:hypothetical protein
MAAVADDRTEETLARLFEALGASTLLVPVRGQTKESVEPAVAVGTDGTTFFAFSDERALRTGLEAAAAYVTMSAPTLAAAVLNDPAATLVVDSGSPGAGRLSRRDLELIRDRMVPGEAGSARARPGGSLRLFGVSHPPPDALLDALAAAAASQTGLDSLHFFEGSFSEGDRHGMVGARFAAGTGEDRQRAALAALSNAVRPHLVSGELLDVIALSDELEEPVAAVGRLVWPPG